MTNLAGLPPRQKEAQEPDDPEYRAAVRELPCVICDAFGERQMSPTTFHHPIHGRFSQRKVPDRMGIPLCDGHHQANFDNSKVAVHREPAKWKRLYGEDHEYIAVTQDRLK
jgi:hypothetical protein